MQISSTIFVFFGFISTCFASDWEYTGKKGFDYWNKHFDACGGKVQSPIDINTEYVIPDPNLKKISYHNYDVNIAGTFLNNGHTAVLNLDPSTKFTITDEGFSSEYRALQLHFHWQGLASNGGSEHTVNRMQYAAEMHIVHIKDGYDGLEEVKDMPDGLAVLGVFIGVGSSTNTAYQPLFDAIANIKYSGDTTQVDNGPTLGSLLPSSGKYYRYSGSLTTPPCYETVAWTVFAEQVKISQEQLEVLIGLFASEQSEHSDVKLVDNFRPTQPMYGRVVSVFSDISILNTTEYAESSEWHYSDSNNWSDAYETCGLKSQSPIDVQTSAAKPMEENPLVLNGYGDWLQGTFINNGHAVQLNFAGDLSYEMSGGGLNGTYEAKQVHFHWGHMNSDGTVEGGSEHLVDGHRFAAEGHIVHLKKDNSDMSKYDAAAVLGFFLEVTDDAQGSDDNSAMKRLIKYAQNVHYTDFNYEVEDGPKLQEILPPTNSFYRYRGSLTTPPCSQIVIWTILTEPVKISKKDFIAFQQLMMVKSTNTNQHLSRHELAKRSVSETAEDAIAIENALIRDNYRPVQDLNGREVHLCTTQDRPMDSRDNDNNIASGSTKTQRKTMQGLSCSVNGGVIKPGKSVAEDIHESSVPIGVIIMCVVGGLIVFALFALIAVKFRPTSKSSRHGGNKYSAGEAGESI